MPTTIRGVDNFDTAPEGLGKVLQVKYMRTANSYSNLTLNGSQDYGVEIFSDTITTIADNSALVFLYSTGQTKKTHSYLNAHFGIFVNGTLLTDQQKKQHDFYDVGQGNDFRYYQQHNAYMADAGLAGTKNIVVQGGGYFGTTGSIIFEFQGESEVPYRNGMMIVMEIAQ